MKSESLCKAIYPKDSKVISVTPSGVEILVVCDHTTITKAKQWIPVFRKINTQQVLVDEVISFGLHLEYTDENLKLVREIGVDKILRLMQMRIQ